MKSRILLLGLAAALGGFSFTPPHPLQAQARGPQSLTALVAPMSLTRDTNGDGLADSVAARVIVPASPALADVEVATNLGIQGFIVWAALVVVMFRAIRRISAEIEAQLAALARKLTPEANAPPLLAAHTADLRLMLVRQLSIQALEARSSGRSKSCHLTTFLAKVG